VTSRRSSGHSLDHGSPTTSSLPNIGPSGGREAASRTVLRRERSPRIALVVACTDRKRLAAPPLLRLGSVNGDVGNRAAEWQQRLNTVDARTEVAEALYSGAHWHWARESYQLTKRFSPRTELWIASAGYGLIRADEVIKPYSATFAPGVADSVWRGQGDGERKDRLHSWWRSVCRQTSLADLIPKRGQGILVIAAGAAYVEAIEEDLRDAVGLDASSERVSVISVGSRNADGLLPVDSRLRRVVGGTNSALNARALAWLAAQAEVHRFHRSSMTAMLERAHAGLPEISSPPREAVTDDLVAAEIQRMRRRSPGISRTGALREFRGRGFACEQGRFAGIWATAVTRPDLPGRRDGGV
jgi:hypothetical protein